MDPGVWLGLSVWGKWVLPGLEHEVTILPCHKSCPHSVHNHSFVLQGLRQQREISMRGSSQVTLFNIIIILYKANPFD